MQAADCQGRREITLRAVQPPSRHMCYTAAPGTPIQRKAGKGVACSIAICMAITSLYQFQQVRLYLFHCFSLS